MVTSALRDAPSPLSPLAARLTTTAGALGVVVAVVGLGVLAGWLFDLQALKSVTPGGASMKANTAVGLLFCGTALALGSYGGAERFVAVRIGLAWIAWAIGAVVVAQQFFGLDVGVDQLIARDPLPAGTAVGSPPSIGGSGKRFASCCTSAYGLDRQASSR